MNLCQAKKKLLAFRDFYGQDIVQTDIIEKAKTLKELREVLMSHRRFLGDQAIDAITNLDVFDREIFGV